MFFILSKLTGFLSSPFWWIIILIITAFFVKKSKLKKRLYLTAFFVFLVFTNPLIFRGVAILWEGKLQPASSIKNKSDVCVVLGGMSTYHEPTGRIRFNQSADRILQAVDLYEKGYIKRIIISGGTARLIRKNRPEAIHLKDFLVSIGIPADSVLIDSLSRNTYENSINTMNLINKHNWNKNIILVTSGYHMKRAEGCFRKAGFTVFPYTTDPLAPVSKITFSDFFLPSSGVLYNWNALTHEWAGIIMYKLKGYM
ncbi:MAG: YdcF family protein [Chlorobi bacterium]|nr:YdcF family protein [Chlorobiota bacterium]